jgi:hypothetical protein
MMLDSVISKPITCHNSSSAKIFVSCNGGQAPYNFNWSNGNLNIKNTSKDTLNDLLSGIYNVTVTDVFGCVVKKDSIQFVNPVELNINLIDAKNVNCKSDTTGTIDINIFGGVLPYQILWNNGKTTSNINNLPAGNYKATVTDANNCVQISNGFEISEPQNKLLNQIDSVKNGDCGLSPDGKIFLTTNGGEFPYKYLWNNGMTTNNIQNLPSGKYVCRVSDALNCVRYSDTINLAQPNSNISILINEVKNNKCAIGFNGMIDITTFGGNTPYKYKWSNGASTEDLTNVAAGNYTVTITDFNNCKQVSSTINVSSPDSIRFTVLFRKKASTSNASDGYLVYKITGGAPPYKLTSSSGVNKTLAQDTIKGLQNGTPYDFAIQDANDCVVFKNNIFVLTENLDIEAIQFASIRPNPVSDQLEINLDFKEYFHTNIRLVNVFGQTIISRSNDALNFQDTFDVNALSAGLYFIQVINTDNQKVMYYQKIIVER